MMTGAQVVQLTNTDIVRFQEHFVIVPADGSFRTGNWLNYQVVTDRAVLLLGSEWDN